MACEIVRQQLRNRQSLKQSARRRRAISQMIESMEKRMMMSATVFAGFSTSGVTGDAALAPSFTDSADISSVASLTIGPGTKTAGSAGNSWGSTVWNASSESLAVTAGDYATFGVTAAANRGITLSEFDLQYHRSGTGPTNFELQYKVNSGAFTDISGSNYNSTSTTNPLTLAPISLSGISNLANLPSGTVVTFRMVAWGASASGGLFYVGAHSTTPIYDLAVSGTSYTIEPAPTVTSIVGSPGPAGVPITVNGTSFNASSSVTFGGVQATSFTVNSDSQITATPPAGTIGATVDVVVTTPNGVSPTGAADQFTYAAASAGTPTVTGVSPATGPYNGGTQTITLTGTNFNNASAVNFTVGAGSPVPAASYTVNSATQITITPPAGTLGTTADITVTTTGGTSATSASDQYLYDAPTTSLTVVDTTGTDTAVGTQRTVTATPSAENANYSISGVQFVIEKSNGTLFNTSEPALSITQTGGTYSATFTPSQLAIPLPSGSYLINATGNSSSGLTFNQSTAFTVATPALGFASSFVTTNQSSPSVTITVNRTFDTADPIAVPYTFTDGTAKGSSTNSAGFDYNNTGGTLYFPANPSAAGSADTGTITVQLYDSSIQPGQVNFNISLGTPTFNGPSGTLGATISNSVKNTMVMSQQTIARAFTPGDYVVYRIGDGTTALGSGASAVFLDEYSPAGAQVQSIPMQTSLGGASGTNQPLTSSGLASGEGFVSLTEDGHYLLVPGYDATPGTASLTSSSPGTINRDAGIVGATGVANTTNTFANWTSSGSPRSIASVGGTALYLAGSDTGLYYVQANGTTGQTATVIASNSGPRVVEIVNNQLYLSTAVGANRITTVGTGLPTTSGQTLTNLPGIANVSSGSNTGVSSPYQYFLTSDNGTTLDTLYIADDSSASTASAGIDKFSLVGGSWVLNNVIAALGARGITGVQNGVGGVTLYITTGGTGSTGGGTIWSMTDTSGYNGNDNGSPTVVSTAITDEVFRGVSLVPQAFVTPGVTSLSSSSGPATGLTTITINGANFSGGSTVSFGGTPATNVTWISSTQLTATIPAGTGGATVDVTVTTPGGTSATSASDQYTYVVVLPSWLTVNSGTATWNSTTKALNLSGGSFTINANPGSDYPQITETSAQLNVSAGISTQLGSLTLTSGSTFTLPVNSTAKYVLFNSSNGLTVNSGTTFDIGNNIIDVANGNLATLISEIDAGADTATWTHTGITSSLASSDGTHLTTIAAINNINANSTALYGTIDGVTAHTTDVLIRYTYEGDANFNGTVDGSDYSNIDSSYLAGVNTGWFNGDFNGDNAINGSDYTLIDNAFNSQGSPLAVPAAKIANPTALPLTTATTPAVFSDKKVKPSSLIDDVENLISSVD